MDHSQDIEDLFMAARAVWSEAHTLVDRARALTMYGPSVTGKHKAQWLDTTRKARKIEGYLREMCSALLDTELLYDRGAFKLQQEKPVATASRNLFDNKPKVKNLFAKE